MQTPLWDSDAIIPLWYPSSNDTTPAESRHESTTVGDVGRFDDRGCFMTYFNIFLTAEDNQERGYSKIPPEFRRFNPPNALGTSVTHSSMYKKSPGFDCRVLPK